uniref:Transporter n=1 Tax=Glossina pallidipes TaxID=7398 RepID=A0A1B0A7D7_GLOPL
MVLTLEHECQTHYFKIMKSYKKKSKTSAFLIPFMVMLILEGIPLFLIELGIGQRMRLGALGVWNTIHPWLGGIGISSCIVTLFVALYYNVIITWVFYYLFNSFRYPLPWGSCPTNGNGSVVEECARSSETAYFWYRTTLDAAPSMEEPGGLKWWIVLCLMLSWTIVFFIVMKGIQSSGKVVYFTSLFPYVVLTIFFVRGITLRGASAGLMHMYTPKVEKLSDPTVWLDAATQVFYSFGLAFGSLIAFGSYNTPKNNCVRDVLLVSVCNAVTAIYASVVIFAILGFKATVNVDRCIDLNKDILVRHSFLPYKNVTMEKYEEVMAGINATESKLLELEECSLSTQLDNAAEGTGLAFIVFTQAIVELPGAPFWAVLFFTMLLSLGLGSQIGILEGMLCTLFDIDIIKRVKKQHVTGVVCLFCFIVGFIFCTGAGEYWLKMFDSFAGTIGLVVVALMEMISVVYIYGHERFTEDIYQMTGYRPGIYWQLTWPGVLPMPIVFLMRSFQCLKVDLDIHQGSIRRNETTASTKEMIDNDDEIASPDMPPQDSLAATRFTIGDFEDDENDFSGPALGGHVKTHSDASDDDDDDDKPVTMRPTMLMRVTGTHLDVPKLKKPFRMEVYDL